MNGFQNWLAAHFDTLRALYAEMVKDEMDFEDFAMDVYIEVLE